jgi:hypothetical protein
MYNPNSLDTICAALAYALGIEAPSEAAAANADLVAYIDSVFGGERADRVIMYNPDAIAQWMYEKYPGLVKGAKNRADIEIPLCSVMPSVTPVCFGTMYTGAQPEVHGIRKYEKPVLRIDTLFDALIRAGKKPVIVGYGKCSLTNIYLEREMDYFIYDTPEEVNAKALELIDEDNYDLIVIYNGNYDGEMHGCGPEGEKAIAALEHNIAAYRELYETAKKEWGGRGLQFAAAFATDHGCHEIDGKRGSHGLDMDEDMHVVHMWKMG